MKNIDKLKYCLIGNLLILTVVIFLSIIFRDDSEYWNIGPNKSLVVISVHIDSWTKYNLLLLLVMFINISKVVIEEVALPILGFNIYNPDKKIITEFTKFQLQFYGNAMYTISSIRQVFLLMLNISQIDIALFNVIICEIASIFTIRMLLNEKQFSFNNTSEEMQILTENI